MRNLFLILTSFSLMSCKTTYEFDSEAALKWSKTEAAQQRKIASSYSFMRENNTWIVITTAQMEESQSGPIYSGGQILRSGYLVYPGGIKVSSIEEAIKVCGNTQGGKIEASENQ